MKNTKKNHIISDIRSSMKLYAVTMESDGDTEIFLEQIRQAIEGGITFLQLRKKDCTKEEYIELAREVKKLTEQAGIPFVINDSVEVAFAVDADGVHLGQEDMNPKEARRILGADKIIGVTAHNVKEALEAEQSGADYLGAGAVFATDTKKNTIPLKHLELKEICDAVRIPVVAIGGINENNINELSGSGIAGVAVVSAIFGAEDVRQAAENLAKKADEMLQSGSDKNEEMVSGSQSDGNFVLSDYIKAFLQNKKGVIFDMDGTILDSMGMWATVGEQYLKMLEIEPKEDINQALKTLTMIESAEYVKREYDLSYSIEEIINQVISMTEKAYRSSLKLKKGIMPLLSWLKERNTKMIVATATEYPLAESALKRNKIFDDLEGIITCTMVNAGKEHPQIYFRASEMLGCEIAECVVFEDSLFAIKTAKEAGFTVIAVYDRQEDEHWEEIKKIADGWIFLDE